MQKHNKKHKNKRMIYHFIKPNIQNRVIKDKKVSNRHLSFNTFFNIYKHGIENKPMFFVTLFYFHLHFTRLCK